MPKYRNFLGDRFSIAGLLFGPLITIGLAISVKALPFLFGMLIVLLALPSIAIAYLIWLAYALIRYRWRAAASVAVGLMLAIGIGLLSAPISAAIEYAAFLNSRTDYLRTVDVERNKPGRSGPVRVVVRYWEQPVFLGINIYYIVYDETDQISHGIGSGEFWPAPQSKTGVYAVDVGSQVRIFGNHFYSFGVTL